MNSIDVVVTPKLYKLKVFNSEKYHLISLRMKYKYLYGKTEFVKLFVNDEEKKNIYLKTQ